MFNIDAFTIIRVQTIEYSPADIDKIIEINALFDLPTKVKILDFQNCAMLSSTAIAAIAGLIRLAESKGAKIVIIWKSMSSRLLNTLCSFGFAPKFGYTEMANTIATHAYREDDSLTHSEVEITSYLENKWLNKEWIDLSESLRRIVIGHIWEVYANAFEHSSSDTGIYSCGHQRIENKELILSVVDLGVGIPDKIRNFYSSHGNQVNQIRDETWLQWAFKKGNTTTSRPYIPRGLGLDFLSKFMYINKGTIEIFSGFAYAQADQNGLRFEQRKFRFPGTCVQLKILGDHRRYCLSNEI